MQIALIILSVLTSGAAVVFGLALRKYQNKIFEESVVHKKALDEQHETINLKDQEINTLKSELEHLHNETKEHAENHEHELKSSYQKGFKEAEIETIDIKEKLAAKSTEVKTLEDKMQHLTENANLSKASEQIIAKIKDLISELHDTSDHCLRNNFFKQREVAHNENITLVPAEIKHEYHLAFDDILKHSALVENEDYLIDKLTADNGEEKCHYTVFIISNETVILVDNKLALFFEENSSAFQANDINVHNEINSIIEERINFLSNKELQDNIIEIVSNLDTVAEVKDFMASIYIPSEIIFNELLKPAFNFFEKINKVAIKPLMPASIVSIVKSAESSFILDDALINYKIVGDIASDIDKILQELPNQTAQAQDSESNETAAASDINQDINTNKTEAEAATTTPETAPLADDFDLDFADDNNSSQQDAPEAAATATPETAPLADDFDLDFAGDNNAAKQDAPEPEAATTTPETAPLADDFDLDFADDNNAAKQDAPEPEAATTTPETAPLADDFDLDFAADSPADTANNSDDNQDNNSTSDFDLGDFDQSDNKANIDESIDFQNTETLPESSPDKKFAPEIKHDNFNSEAMSDQNTSFEMDENVEELKTQSDDSDGNIDQFDIGGFLNGEDNNQTDSTNTESANNNQGESDNLDQFLKS